MIPEPIETDDAALNHSRSLIAGPRWAITVGVILLLHAGHLYHLSVWMWARPHYQYFPLVLAGFAWLVWQRWPQIDWPDSTEFSLRELLYLSVAGGLFVLALRLGSHWLGLISLLMTLWTSVWYFAGKSGAQALRGPFCFLLLMVPLPLDMDLKLIVSLQQLATSMASSALESQNVWHTVSGVAIRTAEKSYLVEEACSGVHSLFSAIAAMLFFCIFSRYGGTRSAVTLGMTVAWVVAANGLRVFLLVFSDTRFHIALDSGWRHEALGVFTYAVALGLTFSSDHLVKFFFPVSSGALLELQHEFRTRVTDPLGNMVFHVVDRPRVSGTTAFVVPIVLLALFFAGPAVVGAVRGLTSPATVKNDSSVSGGLQDQFTETSVSEKIGDWSRVDFQKLIREPGDPFGTSSALWVFRGHGLTAVVSLDGYYGEWHDLAYCYTGSGWKIQEAENNKARSEGQGPQSDPMTHTRLSLYKDAGSSSLVLFSCFDSQRHLVEPPAVSGSLLRTLQNRLSDELFRTGPKTPVVPPVFQVQLFAESGHELLDHERQVLTDLFAAVRSEILARLEGAL